jgi:hypothetical protein
VRRLASETSRCQRRLDLTSRGLSARRPPECCQRMSDQGPRTYDYGLTD